MALPATNIGPGLYAQGRSGVVHTAIHLQQVMGAPALTLLGQKRSLSSAEGINFCPPKPGSTLITSTRSSWSGRAAALPAGCQA